jgi:hypothetical protein
MTLTTILILAMLGTFLRRPETVQYPETSVDAAIPCPGVRKSTADWGKDWVEAGALVTRAGACPGCKRLQLDIEQLVVLGWDTLSDLSMSCGIRSRATSDRKLWSL